MNGCRRRAPRARRVVPWPRGMTRGGRASCEPCSRTRSDLAVAPSRSTAISPIRTLRSSQAGGPHESSDGRRVRDPRCGGRMPGGLPPRATPPPIPRLGFPNPAAPPPAVKETRSVTAVLVNACNGETVHLTGELREDTKVKDSRVEQHIKAHLTGRGDLATSTSSSPTSSPSGTPRRRP